jgi:hypothetical protein
MKGKHFLLIAAWPYLSVCISSLIFATSSQAFIFPDPQGDHDYFFVDCGANVYPGSGTVVATFDIKLFTDNTYPNRISGFGSPVLITVSNNALVSVDTTVAAVFGGIALSGWTLYASAGPAPYNNPTVSPFHLSIGGFTSSSGLDPGTRTMAHIKVRVNQVCTVQIDTLSTQTLNPSAVTEQAANVDFAWGGPPGQGYAFGTTCAVATCVQTYETGTGKNDRLDTVNHIDTYFDCSAYRMEDITRREINDPHGHDGKMRPSAWIRTYRSIPPNHDLWPGTLMTDPDNAWIDTTTASGQRSAVGAHVYTAWAYDYMLHQLGWNGVDNIGNSMVSTVEVDWGYRYWSNASYTPTLGQMLVFTRQTGFYSAAAASDVIAHEWAHAITEHSSQLIFSRESGALSESFSDMLAAAVDYAHNKPHWRIGEDLYFVPGQQLRRMDFPELSNPPQPHTYMEGEWIPADPINCQTPDADLNDFCGVHRNSGVANKMFYLLANGGNHNGVAVTGIQIENAMKVMFRADTLYWDSNTDFVHAATGSIRAAFDINYFSIWPQQTSRAWTAVKVCSIIPGDLNNSNTITNGDIIYLINYLFNRPNPPCQSGCWPINPLCRGDVSNVDGISIGDVIWLVNYVFNKNNPPCVQPAPTNCWLPLPRDVCCKLP